MRQVAGSRLSHGTIVGGDFHPASELARFSPPNMQYILNLFRISLCGEAINYRPYASPSFIIIQSLKTVISAFKRMFSNVMIGVNLFV